MNIKQFRYSADNLGYLIYGKRSAMAIDGGAAGDILDFVEANNLELHYVTNTHSHMDHTTGNAALLKGSGASFLEYGKLIEDGSVEIEGEIIKVYPTPGHTDDCIVFYLDNTLISGDTLFIGKVGRCFTGDHKRFLESVKLIMEFPEDTEIYPGHDYVEEYLDFVRMFEPDNPDVDPVHKSYDPNHVRSTLEQEFRIDPFLRFNDKKIISILESRNLPCSTESERWESLLSIM